MSDIAYIKRYAKQQLNDWLFDPYYEHERKINGAAQFTLQRSRNQIAWQLGFNNWGGVCKTADTRLRFSKLFLKHYWIGKEGYCRTYSHDYEESRKYITENYAYIHELAEYLKTHIRATNSVNMRRSGADIYPTIKSSIVNDCSFIGADKITYGCFIMAAILAGFKHCRNRKTGDVYFNMSAYDIRKLCQTSDLCAEMYTNLPQFLS